MDVQSDVPHEQSIPAVLAVAPLVIGHGSKQQSDAAHTVVAQLTADKSFFNYWLDGHDDAANGVLLPSMLSHVGIKQQSDAAQTVVAQLTADKSFFNDWPVRHDKRPKGVLPPSMLSHVGVVQHSFPLSAQKVQTVDVVVPVLAEESVQVT